MVAVFKSAHSEVRVTAQDNRVSISGSALCRFFHRYKASFEFTVSAPAGGAPSDALSISLKVDHWISFGQFGFNQTR